MLIYNMMLGKHNSILCRVLEKTDGQLQVFTWGASPYCKIVHTIIGAAALHYLLMTSLLIFSTSSIAGTCNNSVPLFLHHDAICSNLFCPSSKRTE